MKHRKTTPAPRACATPNCKRSVERPLPCLYCEECCLDQMGETIEQQPIGAVYGHAAQAKPLPPPLKTTAWHCFQCGHTIEQPPRFLARDGSSWCAAPPDFLFTIDNGEITFVCSTACLAAIYKNNT